MGIMSLDPNGIAYRDEILHALWKIGKCTRPIDSDKQGIYADVLASEKLTRAQLGDMVMTCTKTVKVGFFPTPAKLLEFARPPAINAPSNWKSVDPIVQMEREIDIQTQWLRKFEARADEFRAKCARADIGKLQDRINERRKSRGQEPRYVGVGVETFGSDARSGAGTPIQLNVEDWTRETED